MRTLAGVYLWEGTRHMPKLLGLLVVFLLPLPIMTYADVYVDSQITLQDNTDALVDILNSSVVPGGVRSVSINGNDLLVKRFANPGGDDSEFYHVWKAAEASKLAANTRILSVVDSEDPVEAMLSQQAPYLLTSTNKPLLIEEGFKFANRQSLKLKELVIDAIEKPFTYETDQFRVIASIPVSTISAGSVLARDNLEPGYLFLSEKRPGTTVSNAFWQMQFGENFSLANLFKGNNKILEKQESQIQRYPKSKLTLAFEEKTADWYSRSWSYESKGDVLSHVSHYVDAFAASGFSRESQPLVESDYALLRFSSPTEEATLLVERISEQNQSIQITLQMRQG